MRLERVGGTWQVVPGPVNGRHHDGPFSLVGLVLGFGTWSSPQGYLPWWTSDKFSPAPFTIWPLRPGNIVRLSVLLFKSYKRILRGTGHLGHGGLPLRPRMYDWAGDVVLSGIATQETQSRGGRSPGGEFEMWTNPTWGCHGQVDLVDELTDSPSFWQAPGAQQCFVSASCI